MQGRKSDAAFQEFLAAVGRGGDSEAPSATRSPAFSSMIGSIKLRRGNVIVLGDASPEILEAALRRRSAGKPE